MRAVIFSAILPYVAIWTGWWTREIARGGDAQDWDWRLSVADVESDGPFSRLPGIEREICLLEGAGMQFEFDDGQTFALTPESPRLRFDGGRGLGSRLIDGATRDFNLMWRRGRFQAELWRRPLVGSMVMARSSSPASTACSMRRPPYSTMDSSTPG